MNKFGKIIAIILGIAIIAGGTCGVLILTKNSTQRQEVLPAPEPEPIVTSAKMRILYAGTTFWGRRTNTDARASELGVKYPFSQLGTLERDKYDAWIAGLECPVTDNGHNKAEEENIFKFNCDPDYLPEAAKYFTAFGLGNNHTDNQGGGVGLTTTRKYLDQNGIQYFGTPKYSGNVTSELARDTKEASNCDIVVLPINISYDNDATEKIQMPFGFCSAHGVFGVPAEDYLQNMKTYSALVPTIAMPHMGAEYKSVHDTLRQNVYRKMIDYGVDAVIADHPHWSQDAEAYKGKLIVYSMGNFMFDQTFNKEVVRSAAIEANAEIKNAEAIDFKAWNTLGEACLAERASCFAKIKEAELPRLQITWKYDYHATTSAQNRITRLGSVAEQAEMGARLKWAAIPAEMKVSK